MVKNLIARIIYQYGSQALNSVFRAYKETVKNAPKGGTERKQQSKGDDQQKSSGPFGKFSFNNLISSPMTKDEALKILNLKESEASPENIMAKFEKYFEANDPMKGGSFYVQNKIFYSKEFLMEKYPQDLNRSKFNPDGKGPTEDSTNKNEQDTTTEDEKFKKNDKL